MVVGDQGCDGRLAWMVVVMHRFFHVNGDGDGEPGMVCRFVLASDDGGAGWGEAKDVPGRRRDGVTGDDDERDDGVRSGRHRGAGTILQRRRHQLQLPPCYAVMQRRHATPTQERGNNLSIPFPRRSLPLPPLICLRYTTAFNARLQ